MSFDHDLDCRGSSFVTRRKTLCGTGRGLSESGRVSREEVSMRLLPEGTGEKSIG